MNMKRNEFLKKSMLGLMALWGGSTVLERTNPVKKKGVLIKGFNPRGIPSNPTRPTLIISDDMMNDVSYQMFALRDFRTTGILEHCKTNDG